MSNSKTPKTFSANSLKLLDTSPEEYKLKYEEGLFLPKISPSAKAGQNLHSYLCYYLKGFDITKIENALAPSDREFIEKIKTYNAVCKLKNAPKIQIEQPFLIRCTPPDTKNPQAARVLGNTFYLTGRFDAVLQTMPDKNLPHADENCQNTIQIYDWKTQNLPKNPEDDIQTIVYLYAASKLYKTQDISITYIALVKNEYVTIPYNPEYDYLSTISIIVNKCLP